MKSSASFLSTRLVQTWVCQVGLRDLLLRSIVGPFPDQNHVDQKSRNYKKVRLKHFFYLFRFEIVFSKFAKGEKREMNSSDGFFCIITILVQTWVCQVGLRDFLLCSNCGPLPKQKPCRPKTQKIQKKQIETYRFYLLSFDLYFVFRI